MRTAKIRVRIISALRFHFFIMANALCSNGAFVIIFTALPRLKFRGHSDRAVVVKPQVIFTPFFFLLNKFRKATSPLFWRCQYIIKDAFTFFSIFGNIQEDVIIFCSEYFYAARKNSKLKSKIKIVDHGSLHPALEARTMADENFIFGFETQGNERNPLLIGRLQEEFATADGIFVCSNLAKETFIENGISPSKIFVNHIGFSKHFMIAAKSHDLKTFRSEQEEITIIFVGAAIPRKGLHRFLDALELCRNQRFYITCVGSLPTDPRLVLLMKKDRSNIKLNFVGPVPEEQLHKYYRLNEFFVLPSLCDGFGMVTAQAMMFGCCPIVSKFAGSAELITNNENGFVIDDITDTAKTGLMLNKIFGHGADQIHSIRQRARQSAYSMAALNNYGNDLDCNIALLLNRALEDNK